MKKARMLLLLQLFSWAYISFAHADVGNEMLLPPHETPSTETPHQDTRTPQPAVYRVEDIVYTSSGITQASALKREVNIDKTVRFTSERDVQTYLEQISQELKNTRIIDDVSAHYELLAPDADGTIPVVFFANVHTSFGFLAFPKPSYNSNDGADLKIKLKDKNFLGLMNTLDVALLGHLGTSDAPDDFSKVTLGFDFSYDFPFALKHTRETWSNTLSFSWLLGEAQPDFSYATGITVGFPVGRTFLNVHFTQSFTADTDYTDAGDYFYLTEYGSLSLPITLGTIDNVTPVVYTPSVSVTYNIDKDGITHSDLIGTRLAIGQTLSVSHVNWQNNFRAGYSLSSEQYISYNFFTQELNPVITACAHVFKAFSFFGINTSLYAFGSLNSRENHIGSKLRGIRDTQHYDQYEKGEALSTRVAVTFSADLPIHLITTNWLGWASALFCPYTDLPESAQKILWLPHKLFKYLDFELQIAPFFDMALTENEITKNTLAIKEGYYSAGLEVLIFPLKWSSYVVRTSIGLDVGRTFLSGFLDTSWRDTSVSKLEIFFGLGLHY